MSIPDFLKSQKHLAGKPLNLAISLGLASGFLLIAQAWLLAKIVNAVIFDKTPIPEVYVWLLPMLALFVLRAVLAWSSERVAFQAAANIKRHLREKIHHHLQTLGPAYLKSERSGEMVTMLVDGVEALENYYAKYLPTMSLVVLIPLSILVFVFPFDWLSGLVMLLTAPLIPFFMILIGKGTEHLNKKQWRKLARMSAHFLDMIQGLTTLKIFNASRHEAELISRVSDEYRRSTMSVLRVAFLSSLVLEFLATVSIALVAVFIGFRLFYGEMDFLYGFFVLLLAPEFYLPLRNMGTHYHARLEAIGAAEKMLEVLETPASVNDSQDKSNPVETGQNTKPDQFIKVPPDWSALHFNHLGYSYADGRKALDDISFTLNRGERIAIVGPSGSGKTTLSHLILGFIKTQDAQISLAFDEDTAHEAILDKQVGTAVGNAVGNVSGKIPLNHLDLESWRGQLAWMPQSPHLFHGSIRDNICLGNCAATDSDIKTAASLASADNFIRKLPDGYDTLIGEKGQGLSGGQIQRLALARAFLKPAPLVILDEATANLDSTSEKFIQQGIDELAKQRTLLIVAHRLNTVKNADKILVLDKGRLVEQGRHDALIAQKGLYAELVSAFEGHSGREDN